MTGGLRLLLLITPLFYGCAPDTTGVGGGADIAFSGLYGDRAAILVMREDGQRKELLAATDDVIFCPTVAPGRRLLLFSKLHGRELFVIDVTTGAETQLTAGGEQKQCPAWSPDGGQMAYFSGAATGANPKLMIADRNGQNPRRIATQTEFAADPVGWAPDGRMIAAATAARRLVIIDVASGNIVRELPTPPESRSSAPSWSPDGQEIAFSSERSGTTEIYTIGATGTDEQPLTESPGMINQFPQWSPDGSYLLFARKDGSAGTTYLVKVTTFGDEVPWRFEEFIFGTGPFWMPNR